jgi:hypothetical protein
MITEPGRRSETAAKPLASLANTSTQPCMHTIYDCGQQGYKVLLT